MKAIIVLLIVCMVLLCGCTKREYIERTDTLTLVQRDTLKVYVRQTERDTVKEKHEYYYTIREGGDTTINEVHNIYHSSDKSDSTDYYRSLYEKEKRKEKTLDVVKEAKKKGGWGYMLTGMLIGIVTVIVVRYKC